MQHFIMLFTNKEFEQVNFCPFDWWISCMKPTNFASTCEWNQFNNKVGSWMPRWNWLWKFLKPKWNLLIYFSLCGWLVIDGFMHALLVIENDELNHMLRFRTLSKLIHACTPWGVDFFFGIYCIFLVSYMGSMFKI